MKTLKRIAGCLLLLCLGMAAGHAQTGKSVYGDQVKADVKMNYVTTSTRRSAWRASRTSRSSSTALSTGQCPATA